FIGGEFVQLNVTYNLMTEENMRLALVLIALVVLIDLIITFSGRRLDRILLPIDPARLEETKAKKDGTKQRVGMTTIEDIAKANDLTDRETQVLKEVSRGRTAQQIADQEVLSVYTIRAHIRSIYAKLDVHSKNELIKYIEDRLEK
ncbi:MAG: helix-turn-helix transcriptional regulator, partial [Eggerthellaceae bacterium]|nr:helix-turn-helix transcriptional regulator [Eggerthellaceae bacterium]